MFLNDVKHHTKTDWVNEELFDLNQAKPIIIDETNQLIGNHNTYFLHIQNKKTTICAWKISLYDLVNGKYEVSYLINIFDSVELGHIGIALESFIRNYQGKDKNLFRNKVFRNTDQFIASLLGFSITHYQQLKKIINYCSDELIEKIRAKKIRIAAAADYLPFNQR
ncbi:hypothetical protein [Rickettsiella endosymbiont of Rhagonycha lignosa]|uniref:hypothetical protein n=1 Tax=Rickettsiella endosymbiont of Rhagonycha lignosa TaxID=3077937 RepID=UPI00313EA5FE